MPLPDTTEGIVKELRREALKLGLDIGFDEDGIDGLLCSEAADLIEHYERALRHIAAGEAPAREIALRALDWLARFDEAARKMDASKSQTE